MQRLVNLSRGYKAGSPPALLPVSMLMALQLMFTAACTLTSHSVQSASIHVENVDGPTVSVEEWKGAHPIQVPCGVYKDIQADGTAPAYPWQFRLWDATSGQTLLTRTIDDAHPTLYVTVRWDGVLYGSFRGSGGPAPDPRHRCGA